MQQKDISWEKFEQYNPDKTHSFELLCRLLFKHEVCPEETILVSESNHAGVEVEPVQSKDGKFVSFQSKYFTGKVQYSQIKKSAEETVKKYNNSLDIWYLYTNCSLRNCASYNDTVKILRDNGTEIKVVSNDEILTTILRYQYIMEAFFGVNNLPFSWFKNQVESAVCDLGIRYKKYGKYDLQNINDGNFWKEILDLEDAGERIFSEARSIESKDVVKSCDMLQESTLKYDEIFQLIDNKRELVLRAKFKYRRVTLVNGIIGFAIGVVGSVVATYLWETIISSFLSSSTTIITLQIEKERTVMRSQCDSCFFYCKKRKEQQS